MRAVLRKVRPELDTRSSKSCENTGAKNHECFLKKFKKENYAADEKSAKILKNLTGTKSL
jgi:hypothetical protein